MSIGSTHSKVLLSWSSSTEETNSTFPFIGTTRKVNRDSKAMTDLDSLITPSLILDTDRVQQNHKRMSDIVSRTGVSLRPHIKTHKCIEIARLQTARMSGGITTSTLAEAEAFAGNGFSDITYAVPIEPGKFGRVAQITRSGVTLNLVTDDLQTSVDLDKFAGEAGLKVPVFLKVDCGTHRTGVDPESGEAVSIARFISDAKHLTFAGILTHAGHSYDAPTSEEVRAVARHERDSMVHFAERLRDDWTDVPIVSIGSTPTICTVDDLEGVDEIRPGNYILFDATQAVIGSCDLSDCAVTVLSAVTHRDRSANKVVIDAGAIAMSKDRGPIDRQPGFGYGRLATLDGELLDSHLTSLSQEHGVCHVQSEADLDKLSVGTRVRILANHSCLTVAQHSHFNVLENGRVVDRWEIHRGW
jgi:D-serine deaminase-like pyridoxal phosphate-dependent protein